ncbi:unnamed protein product [Linum tenue]|uniref:Solute carrier family 40 member n=1 Tax=Linum tenue TaxID=586396 RepID=A0AAV0NN44_9ROSI|nr:unnamed protein product [Linum tenue]
MVRLALSESLAPNLRLLSAASGAAAVSSPPPPRICYRVAARRWLTPGFRSPASCRIRNFQSKCSNVNSDVQFSHAVAEDEFFTNEGSSIQGDFLPPIVQLNTEILETPSFGLLVETTDADGLLLALPVLSEEEQNALAATPAHPAGLYGTQNRTLIFLDSSSGFLRCGCLSPAFYANVVTGNIVERLWEFAWPSAIALIHPSLLPVAVMGFFAKSALLVVGPLLGKFMDYYPRVPAYISLNVVQAAAQVLSATMIIHAHTMATTSSSSVVLHPWFAVLVLAGAIEKLCGVALGIANERDWVVQVNRFFSNFLLHYGYFSVILVTGDSSPPQSISCSEQLAGISRPIALAQANAVLGRIDMLAEIAGASMFGVLLSKYGPVMCLKFASTLMIGSLPLMIGLTYLTNKLSSGVLDNTRSFHSCSRDSSGSHHIGKHNTVDKCLETIKLGWKEYIQQPVLPASIAYVLLCFNVVLGPTCLMTAFLTQRGVSPSIIGGFTGLCAAMGVVATFLAANLVKRLGILKAVAFGLIFQASLLLMAVTVYWSGSLSHQSSIIFFLGLIVLSRLGHMSTQVAGAQILQTGIPSSKANLIGITEASVASLAESLMLGVAILANDASHYGMLALLSVTAVVGSAWIFCGWAMNPTPEQRRLFSS